MNIIFFKKKHIEWSNLAVTLLLLISLLWGLFQQGACKSVLFLKHDSGVGHSVMLILGFYLFPDRKNGIINSILVLCYAGKCSIIYLCIKKC